MGWEPQGAGCVALLFLQDAGLLGTWPRPPPPPRLRPIPEPPGMAGGRGRWWTLSTVCCTRGGPLPASPLPSLVGGLTLRRWPKVSAVPVARFTCSTTAWSSDGRWGHIRRQGGSLGSPPA